VGFAEKDLTRFRPILKEPYGMVLVTGRPARVRRPPFTPATRIKSEEDKDHHHRGPGRYQIRGITQILVNEKKGPHLCAWSTLHLVMIRTRCWSGENRDAETAQIAI